MHDLSSLSHPALYGPGSGQLRSCAPSYDLSSGQVRSYVKRYDLRSGRGRLVRSDLTWQRPCRNVVDAHAPHVVIRSFILSNALQQRVVSRFAAHATRCSYAQVLLRNRRLHGRLVELLRGNDVPAHVHVVLAATRRDRSDVPLQIVRATSFPAQASTIRTTVASTATAPLFAASSEALRFSSF